MLRPAHGPNPIYLCDTQVGQGMIENGYVTRVSRGLKAQGRNSNHSARAKSEFRGGDSMYRFDTVGISPFQVCVCEDCYFCCYFVRPLSLSLCCSGCTVGIFFFVYI